jgi:predicted nucleic acid-binding protein
LFTIDASVWVNAYSPAEPGQPASRILLDRLFAHSTPIVVPTLLPIEVAGAIARTRGDSDLGHRLATALLGLPSLRWIALDDPVARQATRLAAQCRLRGADAVYAAVALIHGCALITLDQEHLSRLGPVVRTIPPSEALAALP